MGLTDEERQRLEELAARLAADDPRLARLLDADRLGRRWRRRRLWRWLARIWRYVPPGTG
jgi:hypothetical protein